MGFIWGRETMVLPSYQEDMFPPKNITKKKKKENEIPDKTLVIHSQ